MIQRTRDRRGPGLARRWGRASENDNPAGKAAFGRGPTCPGGTTRCCALTPWLQATGSHPTARNHDQCGDQNRGCPACEAQGRSCHQRPVPVARHSAHLRNAVGRTGCVARPTAHRFNRISIIAWLTLWKRRNGVGSPVSKCFEDMPRSRCCFFTSKRYISRYLLAP